MKVWRLYGAKDLRMEEEMIPVPGKDEVLIRVRSAGICGSDLSYYRHGKIGVYKPSQPFVIGHELSGEIAELGPGVKTLKKGARVGVDPSMCCGTCSYCLEGRSNICRKMKYLGSAMYKPPVDGAFREYLTMPAKNCHVLPEALSYKEGALLEPLSVAFHAFRRAGSVLGSRVLILGAGTIGQYLLSFARSFGAEQVLVCDPRAKRREIALKRGADLTFDPIAKDFMEGYQQKWPEGAACVFEASGVVSAASLAIECARVGGTIVQVGLLPADAEIPATSILFKELSVLGSFRFGPVYTNVLDACESGCVKAEDVVSKTFAFEDLPQALQYACEGDEVMKVQVEM